jgi:hypothetical protein
MSSILRDKNIALEVRSRLYVQLIIPVLLYGSECWQLSADSKRKLDTFHNNCCRKIAGVSEWRQWKMKVKTSEIAATMGVAPVTWYTTKRFIKWIGHVVRMSDQRLLKRLMFAWRSGGTVPPTRTRTEKCTHIA